MSTEISFSKKNKSTIFRERQRININHIIFSVFESSMEEIEFFLDDISKDMLENKTTKKSDALQNLICFDKNEQTILLNNRIFN